MTTFQPQCVLVTGGAGFIGSNFIRWLLAHDSTVRVINLDLLTYAGNLESLEDVVRRHGPDGDGRYYFVQGDIRDFRTMACLLAAELREATPQPGRSRSTPLPDAVVHLAAESHVDRSIMGPTVFVDTLPMQNAWQRMMAGLPIVMLQAQGPGHIAFSRDAPGEMIETYSGRVETEKPSRTTRRSASSARTSRRSGSPP